MTVEPEYKIPHPPPAEKHEQLSKEDMEESAGKAIWLFESLINSVENEVELANQADSIAGPLVELLHYALEFMTTDPEAAIKFLSVIIDSSNELITVFNGKETLA